MKRWLFVGLMAFILVPDETGDGLAWVARVLVLVALVLIGRMIEGERR